MQCGHVILYESDVTFSSKITTYNADVIAVWANEIGLLQISNRYYWSIADIQSV